MKAGQGAESDGFGLEGATVNVTTVLLIAAVVLIACLCLGFGLMIGSGMAGGGRSSYAQRCEVDDGMSDL